MAFGVARKEGQTWGGTCGGRCVPAQRTKNGVLGLRAGNIQRWNERGNEVRKRGSFKIVEQLACRFYSVSTREPWKVYEEEKKEG